MRDDDHDDTVGTISPRVEISHGACRSLPDVAALGHLTADGSRYASTLGSLLSLCERRLADRTHPEIVAGIADAIIRRQRAA